jgi:putative tryptophan/tyrosine transport system substrate-binding protein
MCCNAQRGISCIRVTDAIFDSRLHMRRREFITLLGGAIPVWPLGARAQQPDRMRRIGVLVAYAEGDPEMGARLAAFRQGLERLGWSEGRNIQIDTRFAPAGAGQEQLRARELVALKPDVIFAHTPQVVAALQRESRQIPIVFVGVADPVEAGFIASLARPGGNATGLLGIEASIAGKWLSMLKEIAPITRVALLANPKNAFDYFLHTAEPLAKSLAIELVPSPVTNAAEIEHAIESFARRPNGGLVLPTDATTSVHRDLIIALAVRHRLPAVYGLRAFVTAGGLMSYGTDFTNQNREAASYVDRILRGEKAADLPVQAPTKYETVVNLKTARALGLTVPPGLLVAADEVID